MNARSRKRERDKKDSNEWSGKETQNLKTRQIPHTNMSVVGAAATKREK